MTSRPGINFDVFGVNVRLEYGDDATEALKETVEHAWSGALAEHGPGDVAVSPVLEDDDVFMENLSTSATMVALEHRAEQLMMFHAAGIALADGQVVAFIGPSGRGKTTLSRALAKRYGYVSDETVAVDGDLTVLPYRKPLSVKRTGKPKKQVAPSVEGLKDLPEARLTLAKLVVLDRREGVEGVHVEPVPLLEAFGEIVPETSYLVRKERPLQQFAEICARTDGVVRLVYSEASTVLDLVPELADVAGGAADWRPAMPENGSPAAERANEPANASDGDGVDRVLTVDDTLDAVAAEESVVLLGGDGVLRVLAGVGPEIWDCALRGRDLQETVSAVVERYGHPPEGDPNEIVMSFANELVDEGILCWKTAR